MFHWLKLTRKLWAGRPTRAIPRRATRIRLEMLEDRLAPATFNVTTLADSATAHSGSLRAAILASDFDTTPGTNIINLTKAGTYKLTLFGNAHDGTNGALRITSPRVTIQNTSGGKVIIDGGGGNRVFDIEGKIPSSVTFSGVTIQNGLASTNSNGTTTSLQESGAGIFSPRSDVTLKHCVVKHNLADEDGGGIYTNSGKVTLKSSIISGNNAASSGGGIYCDDGTITATSSTISGNVATRSGGGMYDRAGSISLKGCTIAGNSAHSNAGGVGMGSFSTGNLTISKCIITDNVADSSGGGVYKSSTSGTTSVTHSIISGNSAGGKGGGLYLQALSVTVSKCTITNNTADGDGGGLDADGNSGQTLTVTSCTISNNTADGNGGGLDAGTGGQTTGLTSCTLSGNVASNGGGVAFYGTALTIATCTITGNRAQGADGGINAVNSTAANASFSLSDSTVSNNRAGSSAGGIDLSLTGASTATISNSHIDGNHAGSDEGGAFIAVHTLTINKFSSFNDNRSGSSYGGLDASVGMAHLTNVTFVGNHSGGSGGGLDITATSLDITATPLVITGCTITNNSSGSSYGGVFADGRGTISHTTISNNQAGGSVGGLYFLGEPGVVGETDTSLTLLNDTITNNTSGSNAGGAEIFASAGGSITGCTISGNSAAGQGGGLYTDSSSNSNALTITACTLSHNHSVYDGGGLYEKSSGSAGTSLTNDTVFGNTASVNGGGIAFEGSGTDLFNYVTIDGNVAASGGGVFENSGPVDVHSSIIARNAANAAHGPDVNGAFTTQGFNFIGVADGARKNFIDGLNHDQVGSVATPKNPRLGPLKNNGGPTFTQALLSGSTAINAGDPTNPPNTDQRGFPRPGVGHPDPSIGAFEP